MAPDARADSRARLEQSRVSGSDDDGTRARDTFASGGAPLRAAERQSLARAWNECTIYDEEGLALASELNLASQLV